MVSHLPTADFFVVEKTSISLQNTALYPVMAHMRTVEAMLFTLLEPRYTPLHQHDANRRRPPFWPHGGRVAHQRGPGGATDDGVSDSEDSEGDIPSQPVGEIQEFLPDGRAESGGGAV